MSTYVILPVTQECFDEIADEVAARGQADRVEGSTMIKLYDVVLAVAPDKKIAPVKKSARR